MAGEKLFLRQCGSCGKKMQVIKPAKKCLCCGGVLTDVEVVLKKSKTKRRHLRQGISAEA